MRQPRGPPDLRPSLSFSTWGEDYFRTILVRLLAYFACRVESEVTGLI